MWRGKWRGTSLTTPCSHPRPISSSKGEINGTLYRARYLIKVARDALKPAVQEDTSSDSMQLEIVKQPLGVIA